MITGISDPARSIFKKIPEAKIALKPIETKIIDIFK
jgi:hypothetical protein